MNRFFTILLAASCLTAVGQSEYCLDGTVWDEVLQGCVPAVECTQLADIDDNGNVGTTDLLLLLSEFGFGLPDEDGDGICDAIDDCVGDYDECGICNGPGPTIPVVVSIVTLYDSVYAAPIDEWFVFEIGSDTTFSLECAYPNICENEFEDDDDDYAIGGLTEAINYGNFYNSTTTNFELRCFSPSISGGVPNYNGMGNLVYLNLHTNGSLTGTYTFNSNGFNPSMNTWDGGVLTNENMYNYSLGSVFPVAATGGTVAVAEGANGLLEVEFDIFSSVSEYDGCYYGVPIYYNTDGSGGSSGSGSGSIISNDGESLKLVNPATW